MTNVQVTNVQVTNVQVTNFEMDYIYMFPLVISSLLGFFFIAKNCFLIGCHFIPTNSSWFITDAHLPQPARCPPAVVLPGWKKFKLIALGQILHITPMTDVMLQVVR